MIYINHSKPLFGTLKRQNLLEHSGLDACRCQRCSDPSELGSFNSGVFCRKCPADKGILLPANSLDKESHWICNKCGDTKPFALIATLLDVAEQEFDGLQGLSIDKLEALIKKYEGILHPHHYFIAEAKWNLCDKYGFIEDENVYGTKGLIYVRGALLYSLFSIQHMKFLVLDNDPFSSNTLPHAEVNVKLKNSFDEP